MIVLLGFVGLVAPSVSSAAGPGCHKVGSVNGDGDATYTVVCPGDAGDPGNPGSGDSGSAAPTCDLSAPLTDYCIGSAACWKNVPPAVPPPAGSTGPTAESVYQYQWCEPDPGGLTGYTWVAPAQPTIGELAEQAVGALKIPAFTLGFNPPTRTIVGVPTWFWARDAGTAEIVGSSALGVRAIGTPKSMKVDPGDGSGVMTCPWSATRSDACASTYRRSSAGETGKAGNLPAYTARAWLVYDIRFENNGAVITVPGMPDTLESPEQTVPIPVAEVQSLVTSGS